MPHAETKTRSVVVERVLAHSPDKVWRALTQPHLISEWLMKNDFAPAVDHRFKLTAGWGEIDCRVVALEPPNSLSYTWEAMGLESVVTWTLTSSGAGTHLRMEQAGFRPDQKQALMGATAGWTKFFDRLEAVAGRA